MMPDPIRRPFAAALCAWLLISPVANAAGSGEGRSELDHGASERSGSQERSAREPIELSVDERQEDLGGAEPLATEPARAEPDASNRVPDVEGVGPAALPVSPELGAHEAIPSNAALSPKQPELGESMESGRAFFDLAKPPRALGLVERGSGGRWELVNADAAGHARVVLRTLRRLEQERLPTPADRIAIVRDREADAAGATMARTLPMPIGQLDSLRETVAANKMDYGFALAQALITANAADLPKELGFTDRELHGIWSVPGRPRNVGESVKGFRRLLTTKIDERLALLNGEQGMIVPAPRDQGDDFHPSGIELAPDDDLLAVGGLTRSKLELRLYDFRTLQWGARIPMTTGSLHLFLPGKKTIAVSIPGQGIGVFDQVSGKLVVRLKSKKALSLRVSKDGRFIAAGTAEGVEIWETEHWSSVLRVDGAKDPAFSSDGRRFAALDGEGRVHVWKIESAGRFEPELLAEELKASNLIGFVFSFLYLYDAGSQSMRIYFLDEKRWLTQFPIIQTLKWGAIGLPLTGILKPQIGSEGLSLTYLAEYGPPEAYPPVLIRQQLDDLAHPKMLGMLPRDFSATENGGIIWIDRGGQIHLTPELAPLGAPAVEPAKAEAVVDAVAAALPIVPDMARNVVESLMFANTEAPALERLFQTLLDQAADGGPSAASPARLRTDERRSHWLPGREEQLRERMPTLYSILRDPAKTGRLLFALSLIRLGNPYFMSNLSAVSPIEWARLNGAEYRLGELRVVPSSESFRRFVFYVDDARGRYAVELKIPGEEEGRDWISPSHFFAARDLVENYPDDPGVVAPIALLSYAGDVPLYGYTFRYPGRREPLNLALFEYEDGKRLWNSGAWLQAIAAAMSQVQGLQVSHADVIAQVLADAAVALIRLHRLGWKGRNDGGTDVHGENIRVLANGRGTLVADFGAFERARLPMSERHSELMGLLGHPDLEQRRHIASDILRRVVKDGSDLKTRKQIALEVLQELGLKPF